MYDSDFVSTVKVTGSLEWPFARLVRMNSFQPTADERNDIPTKTGCSSLYTDGLMRVDRYESALGAVHRGSM